MINSNNTRWGSVFKMLERYVDLSDSISNILLVKMHGDTNVTPILGEQLKTVKELITFLKPFHMTTQILCGETYVTGSECIPLIKNLKSELINLPTTTEISKKFKKLLLDGFEKRFKSIEGKKSIAAATIVDPRFKKMYFSSNVACSEAINLIGE